MHWLRIWGVDHPQKQKDDCANAAAGVLVMMNYKIKHEGDFLESDSRLDEMSNLRILSSLR